jgi:predicted regulator of Ras-like GTPase activity (Roadblock/LC7/MglB family)
MPAPIGNIGAPVKARFDGTEPPITATLGHLSAGWPEPVRQEILDFHLEGAQVNIPVGFLEQALKQGRVVTNWKTVRQWLRPAAPVKISPVDATPLELPLQVVTPPFLARQRVRLHERQKVEVDKDIPNLFFGFPQPETPQAPKDRPPGSGDTNYFVWDDATDEVKAQSPGATSGRTSPGTRFVSKYATPNEVVSRAAVLEGVAGALIALPDGLMVASRLSPDLNGETLAAFLPQIFGKVSQSTKELRMGELNNLNFTVGNVPWKIFRVNAIYFAAFGREGQALPTATLAGLAAELDHNK